MHPTQLTSQRSKQALGLLLLSMICLAAPVMAQSESSAEVQANNPLANFVALNMQFR